MTLPECDCRTWAVTDHQKQQLGNGHNPACLHFVPEVNAIQLIKKMIVGIRWWGEQEDGIPEELWDAYKEAVWIVEGRVLSEVRA